MKRLIILLFIVSVYSCKDSSIKKIESDNFTSNLGLEALYESDQEDRLVTNIDWSKVSIRDKQREARVYQLLDSNKVTTSDDYANAAMIFQHGNDTIASRMAVNLMRKAVELDSTRNKWLLAAAIDRDLMRRKKPQVYGTQYTKNEADEPWRIYKLDSTKINDSQRREYGVETLSEQREKLRRMNKKNLNDLLASGKSIDDILKIVKNSDLIDSEFDLSESGINSFGYELIADGKNKDALKILKLNTELYPEGFNTFDSYGECLIKLGKLNEGIEAYKKSLRLNPGNENAKTVLKEIEK